ncbi:hypothetical protein [Salipiger sp. PrR002]|uniref:hypothetical protein n=1 Tax=Salipiger sp. PrR002 TaxID=2706489 RepID=UPI0034CE9BC9
MDCGAADAEIRDSGIHLSHADYLQKPRTTIGRLGVPLGRASPRASAQPAATVIGRARPSLSLR